MEERSSTGIGLVDFLLAGWLGGGLAFTTVKLAGFGFGFLQMEPDIIIIFALNLFPQVLGGIIAVFLLTMKTRHYDPRNDLRLGLLSLAMYTLMMFQINLYSIIGFAAGSYLGGILTKRKLGL